jgi:ribosome-binding protein aMBF1 (putative translation factor)
MDTTLLESVWTKNYISNLPDNNFLFVEAGENKATRRFPYKGEDGKISLPNLLNSLAQIQLSSLSKEEKKKITSKARRIAKSNDIDVSEEFLDDVELTGALFPPYLEQTLLDFNSGMLTEGLEAEEIDYWGKKIAKRMSDSVTVSHDETEYDEDGNPVSSDYSSMTDTEYEYQYQDGLVVRTKSKSGYSYSNENEYEMPEMSEEYGASIKKMRRKKGMTRSDMAAKMSMNSMRLGEIEDGDDPTESEISQIASALGVTKRKLRNALDKENEVAEETSGIIHIVRNIVNVVREIDPFTKVAFEEMQVRGKTEEVHRIYGKFVVEETKKRDDGTLSFAAPLFKLGELTSNGNRYMKECAEFLVEALKNMKKNLAKKESTEARRTPLDIAISKYLEGRTPDMLATHRGRFGEGNPLLERAAIITGGYIGKSENDPAFFITGETIPTTAGKDIAVQVEMELVKGLSLVGLPTKFEENNDGGHDIFSMHLIGSDFTDEGGNLIQFKDQTNAGFIIN